MGDNFKLYSTPSFRDKSKPRIDDSGFLALMFMSWATPVIVKGFKKPLYTDDLDKLSNYETAAANFQRGKRIWKEEVGIKGLQEASLPRVAFKAVKTRMLVGVIIFLMSQIVTFLGPVSKSFHFTCY